MWGALESESESESEDEGVDEEAKAPQPQPEMDSGLETPAEGLDTPSGLQSVSAGLETPDIIELRKSKDLDTGLASSEAPPQLYQVLPQRQVEIGDGLMGTQHVYDVSAAIKNGAAPPSSVPSSTTAPSGEASQKKRKMREQQEANKSKKYKEFKF